MTTNEKPDPTTRIFGAGDVVEDIDLDEAQIYDADGQRLDEKRAAEIAAEVLDKARTSPEVLRRGLIPGGKSLSGAGASPVIQTRVPTEVRDRLVEIATERGMSVSKLTRQVLEQFAAGDLDATIRRSPTRRAGRGSESANSQSPR